MKNRKLLLIVSLVLALTMSLGGTLAYLQDYDADVNTMTLGNVKIEQLEYERVVEDGKWVSTNEPDNYGYAPDELKEFEQNKPLLPAVFRDGAIKWDDRVGENSHKQSWGQVGAPGACYLFDDSVKNVVDKFVFVKNTGKTDAYVRTIFAFEQGSVATEDFEKVIATNGDVDHWDWVTVGGDIEINGNKYLVAVATYNGPSSNPTGILAANAVTYPSLLQVYMKPEATNKDVEAIDGNGNGTYDILVLSQAIQADGFEDAATAFKTSFNKGEDLTMAMIEAWFEGEEEVNKLPKIVTNDEELAEEIKAGKTEIKLAAGTYHMPAAQGKTLTLTGAGAGTVIEVVPAGAGEAGGQLDYSLDGSTVTFNNLTIKTNNQTYAGYARLKATYNNCVMDQCYCLNDVSEFNGCTFNVAGDQYNLWTWGAPTATLNDCTFNSDGKAILLYGTVNTKLTLNDCVFNDKGGLTDKKAAVEIGNDYNKSYELIVNDTVVNGYEINDKGIDTGSTLWGNKNSMSTDKLNVVVDGVDVY